MAIRVVSLKGDDPGEFAFCLASLTKSKAPSCTCLSQTGAGGAFDSLGCTVCAFRASRCPRCRACRAFMFKVSRRPRCYIEVSDVSCLPHREVSGQGAVRGVRGVMFSRFRSVLGALRGARGAWLPRFEVSEVPPGVLIRFSRCRIGGL